MKRKNWMIALFCALFMSVWANDGVYLVNGNHLFPLNETDISIEKEVLTISIGDDGFATVDVRYVFFNKANDKMVMMGFEADAPYNDMATITKDFHHPYINNFTVVMNGQTLPFDNALVAVDQGDTDFKPLDLNRWKETKDEDFAQSDRLYDAEQDSIITFAYAYYFKANFKKGRNEVHHTYRYRMSYGVGRTFEVPYWLRPAMRWANHQIDDFTFRIKAENTSKHFCFADSLFAAAPFTIAEGQGKIRTTQHYDTKMVEVSLRNGTLEWHATRFKPVDNLTIYSADFLYAFSEQEKIGSFYDRNEHYVPFWKMGLDFKMNKKARRIMRNLPYASRGYVFTKKSMRDYFNQFWWYMPDPSWKPSTIDFTPQEKKWINGNI